MNRIIKSVKTAFRRIADLKSMPLRLEFLLTDYCNLNCKGCTHFSPLAEREFEPLEMVSRQMEKLAAVCGDAVKQVYLIGGETLLYPDLTQAMDVARRYFHDQKIYIFTNGLLLPRMSADFWEAARRNDIIIAITRYPIKFDYDAAEELCRTKGVDVEVFADRSDNEMNFFRFALDPEGRQNRYITHFKCYNRGCISVAGGYVYPCSICACVHNLNRATGTDFQLTDKDRLDVNAITNVRQIKRLRDLPSDFCRYCKNPPARVGHALSQRRKEEWVD